MGDETESGDWQKWDRYQVKNLTYCRVLIICANVNYWFM